MRSRVRLSRNRVAPAPATGVLAVLLAALTPIVVPQTSRAEAVTGATPRPPDVVIILTDDQRVDSLARMEKVHTEIVDRGRSFGHAMVPTSLCCPSRSTILTGLFAHSTRVFSNAAPEGGWQRFHDEGLEDRTLAVELERAGYRTGLVGKYLNGFAEASPAGYVPPGWGTFVTFTSGMGYYDYTLSDGTSYGEAPEDYSTDVLARYADDFIRSTPDGTPLFLYLAPWAPHSPSTPAPRHAGAWEGRIQEHDQPWFYDDVSDMPAWLQGRRPRSPERIDADLARIQESLLAVDDAVGTVMDALSESGRLDDTLVIYLSDNGVTVGEHRLREWKNLPYRSMTEIPLAVRWDGHVRVGTVATRLALNVDVAPTIAAATGTSMDTEGLDLLSDVRRTGFPLEGTFWIRGDSPPHHPAYCGYRTHRWMYTHYGDGTEELFDYRNDPYELHNLAGRPAFADERRQLRRQARESCRPVPSGFSW